MADPLGETGSGGLDEPDNCLINLRNVEATDGVPHGGANAVLADTVSDAFVRRLSSACQAPVARVASGAPMLEVASPKGLPSDWSVTGVSALRGASSKGCAGEPTLAGVSVLHVASPKGWPSDAPVAGGCFSEGRAGGTVLQGASSKDWSCFLARFTGAASMAVIGGALPSG